MYKVIKGWPSNGAIDLNLFPATGVTTLEPGQAACINNEGKLIVGTYLANGSDAADVPVFIIDKDPMTGSFTCLLENFVLEVDSDHYATDTYTPTQAVSIVDGKFIDVDTSQRTVGRVLDFNATTGKMIVAWLGIN